MRRRWVALVGAAALAGCGLAEKLPKGPVVSERARAALSPAQPSGAVYEGEPAVPFPVLPVLAWGAAYDLDLVVVSKSPDWDMHEYARLATPQGPVWLVKEARAGTLEQTLVAELPGIEGWMPELPMRRANHRVEVEDRSVDGRVDVALSYDNIDGVPVVARFTGDPPTQDLGKRNGSTMGHSRDHVMAVLDLPSRGFGRAQIAIGGEDVGVERILGVVPFAMSLVQTQAGLAIGDFTQEGGAASFLTVHHKDAGDVSQPWSVDTGNGHVVVEQVSDQRSLMYRYLDRDGAWELASITTFQWGREVPTSQVALQPALPDLRRRFDGVHRSRFVVDVNGQQGHATGTLEAWWEEDGPRVRLVPEEPWWVADRPMLTTVTFADGAATVHIERVEATDDAR